MKTEKEIKEKIRQKQKEAQNLRGYPDEMTKAKHSDAPHWIEALNWVLENNE